MATLVRCARLLAVNSVKYLPAVRPTPIYGQQIARNFSCTSFLGADRRYSDKHEWVTLDGNVGTIGISQYAQESLGDIVYAQLPDEGDEFDREDDCGALESVKAASELYSPISGKVTEKNTAVEEDPALINKSCYDDGWLFKMELSSPDEMNDLMDEDAYDKFLKSQE